MQAPNYSSPAPGSPADGTVSTAPESGLSVAGTPPERTLSARQQRDSSERASFAEPVPGESGYLRLVWTIWLWVEFSLLAVAACTLSAIAWVLLWPFDRRRAVPSAIVRASSVAVVKLNPMWKFEVHGPLPAYRPARTVCVSNHRSHTDVFLIYHLPWNVKWLAKASLFRIPFLGWSMWFAGHVSVHRGRAQSAKAAMKRCADWLERGVPIAIFPEGTRSTTSEMLPFRDGAFRLAIETGADLLPMAVAGTGTALRKHDWKAGYSRGVLTVGEPISTQGMTLGDVPELKERVRREILALKEQIERPTR